MLVRITNLAVYERSIPTPANTSIPIKPSQVIEFEYPKAYDWFFLGLTKYNFKVDLTTQLSDITPVNPDLDFSSFDEFVLECQKLMAETEICDDNGIHVKPEDTWVSQEVYDTFKQAIEDALKAKQSALKQEDLEGAIQELTEAKENFELQLKPGTKPPEIPSKIMRYGFAHNGSSVDEILDTTGTKDNSFFILLDKPVTTEQLIASLEIDQHKYDTLIQAPPIMTISVLSEDGQVLVWSLGSSKEDTDVDTVDDAPVSEYEGEWPVPPFDAKLTIVDSNDHNEPIIGADNEDFVDREVKVTGEDTVVDEDLEPAEDIDTTEIDKVIEEAQKIIDNTIATDEAPSGVSNKPWYASKELLSQLAQARNDAMTAKTTARKQAQVDEAANSLQETLDTVLAARKAAKVFEFVVPDGSKQLGNKLISDLQQNIQVEGGKITGTLPYVPDFMVNGSKLTGNYFVFLVNGRGTTGAKVTIQLRNKLGILATIQTGTDYELVKGLKSMAGLQIIIKQRNDGSTKDDITETYDLSGLVNGEKPLDTKALEESIAAAKNAKQGVVSSTHNGKDVDPGTSWVTSEQMSTFEAAIQAAETAKSSATKQDDIESAKKTLDAAVEEFNSQKQDGTYVAPTKWDEVISISAFDQDTECFGKYVRDLQEDNISASGEGFNVLMTGTLKYVKDWKQFSSVVSEQSGHYLAIKIDPVDEIDLLRITNSSTSTVDEDIDPEGMIIYVKDKNQKVTVKANHYGHECEVTLLMSNLTLLEPEPVKQFTISAPSPEESFGNMTFGDLQDITINEDKTVTGTVHYVNNLIIKDTPLNGSYCAIKVERKNTELDQVTVQFRNNLAVLGTIDTGSDIVLIPSLKSMTGARLIVKQTRKGSKSADFEETYDLSKLVFEAAPVKAVLTEVKVADRTHSWKDVTYNQLMADDVQANLEGKEITVTGTLFQKDSWSAYPKESQNKWYPVLNLVVENDKQAIALYKADGEKSSVHHFESNKPNDDIIFSIDNDTKSTPRKIVVYQTEDDANNDKNGNEYTINFSGCTLLTNTPAELEFEMADQSHSWKNVAYSEIQSPEASLTKQGDTLKVSGTFYKVNNWSAFGKKNQNKWYIATKVTRPENSVVEGSDGRSFLADKLSDDIVYAFDSTQDKPIFKVYPTAKHKELDFAGRTYTMDLTQVELVDPYVTLSINSEKTYDIDDPTKLGTFNIANNEITGNATKYFGQIASRENKPEQQTGYYISVVANPWEGVEASKNGKDYVPMAENGKVLVFLGQTENNVDKLYLKNTKANNHIDEFSLNVTCDPDDTIPSVEKVGYFATKDEFNKYLTDQLKLSADQMNVDDQVFYIHYNAPLDNATDYVTVVEVKDHKYGVAHKHVEAAETVTYFSMKNGFQVDYVDGIVKTDNDSAKCELSDYHGNAKVILYRVDGAIDYAKYPEKMDKMIETTVTIA